MSSYWAGYWGSALVLTEAEFCDFVKHYAKIHHIENIEEKLKEARVVREYEWKKSLGDGTFEILDVLSHENDGMTFWPFMKKNKDGKYEPNVGPHLVYNVMRSENCYVIFSDKNLDDVRSFFEMRYPSYEVFKQEFKDKMEAYLPKDFDWDAHLGNFSYAAYA